MNLIASIASQADGKNTHLGRANLDFTLSELIRIATDHKYQVSLLAEELESSSVLATSENIFDWVRSNIEYRKDKENKEQLRRPARLIKDGHGDCDCTSILISSILQNLGIPHFFRVVDIQGQGWEHIYVVAIDENGQEITLDTVPEILFFNYEHPYKKRKDFKMNTLQGIEENTGLNLLRGYFTQMKIALTKLPNNNEVRTEKALLKTVEIFLEDPENVEQVLENAATKSVLFKEVYQELSDFFSSQQLGAVQLLPLVTGAQQIIQSGVGKAVSNGIKKIFGGGSGVGGIGEVAVKPGDTFSDNFGNTINISSDFDSGLGYKISVNNIASTIRISEVAIGMDGKLYVRNRGGRDNDPDYLVVDPTSNHGDAKSVRFLYKAPKNSQGQWPQTVLQYQQQMQQQNLQRVQQQPFTLQNQQQVQQQSNIQQGSAQQPLNVPFQNNNNIQTATRSTEAPENQSFFEKNKTALIIASVTVALFITGITTFLALKK